jgi:hypothetical protein
LLLLGTSGLLLCERSPLSSMIVLCCSATLLCSFKNSFSNIAFTAS